MLDRKRIEAFLAIPMKANKVLQIVSCLMLCIGLRLCYLTICQYEVRVEQARASMQKTVFEPALRGTIQDRFGITIARNEVAFQVSVVWAEIAHAVPRWAFSESLEHRRIPLRKRYVQAFTSMLAKELQLDPKRIEDVIYSYAIFSHTVPVPLKTDISERLFYRLQAKARFWPGLVVERVSKRVYPRGCSLCHVVGYTAPLGREEYDAIISEIHELRSYLKAKEIGEERDLPLGITSYFHAKERLAQLERSGYGMFDSVGKSGIEASFDEQLRGIRGFKKYIMNSKGDTIALSSASCRALSGKRVLLTISSELQEYAEKLLLETESARKRWQKGHQESGQSYPFFRGGAIVALDPKTSEIVALASTPRFDPNDCAKRSEGNLLFKNKKAHPTPWIRNDLYAEALWNMVMPLSYEKIGSPLSKNSVERDEKYLDWNLFLRLLCPSSSFLQSELDEKKEVFCFLEAQKELFHLAEELRMGPRQLLERAYEGKLSNLPSGPLLTLLQKARSLKELSLYFDMSRLLLRYETIPKVIYGDLCHCTLREIHEFSSEQALLLSLLEEKAFEEFQRGPFRIWRTLHEKQFLLEKRKEEETLKKVGKPYLHYLDAECRAQFDTWWKDVRVPLLKACAGIVRPNDLCRSLRECLQEGLQNLLDEKHSRCFAYLARLRQFEKEGEADSFIVSLQSYKDIHFDLLNTYRVGGSRQPIRTGRELISSLFMLTPPPTLSFAFSQTSPPGSVFKLVTGYAAMEQHVLSSHTPLTPKLFVMEDRVYRQGGKVYVGFDVNRTPLPQLYKGGRLPKSMHSDIGEIDMIGAIEHSSNPYFSLLADEKLKAPGDLIKAAKALGFGEKTGLCLPFEAKGHLPNDLSKDKTNLYTTAIGQHTLLSTPIQVAMMLSCLTTDGTLYVPKLVKMAMGRDIKRGNSFSKAAKAEHRRLLQHVGIDFPLFIEHSALDSPYKLFIPKRKCTRKVPLDPEVQSILMRGMDGVIRRLRKTKEALSFDFSHNPQVMRTFLKNEHMIGKSGTAECLETIGLLLGHPPYLYNHTWFGAVFLDEKEEPDLVVVVFLRYGKFGRQVAPLASAIYEEWKHILEIHKKT